MVDYRISVEELESQAEIMEMARNIVKDAFEFENSMPTMLVEENNVPFLNNLDNASK
jgi:hypothetical protein